MEATMRTVQVTVRSPRTQQPKVAMTKEEFRAKLEHSSAQATQGKTIRMHENESSEQFINRLLCMLLPHKPMPFYYKTMVNNINNFGVINFYESNSQQSQKKEEKVEEIVPVEDPVSSIIFTKKAKKEAKQTAIIEALKKSIDGRRDKTRAFVDELHSWQNDGYVDAHYNAQVMYDELRKLLPISFGYEVFKKHYNNTRS